METSDMKTTVEQWAEVAKASPSAFLEQAPMALATTEYSVEEQYAMRQLFFSLARKKPDLVTEKYDAYRGLDYAEEVWKEAARKVPGESFAETVQNHQERERDNDRFVASLRKSGNDHGRA